MHSAGRLVPLVAGTLTVLTCRALPEVMVCCSGTLVSISQCIDSSFGPEQTSLKSMYKGSDKMQQQSIEIFSSCLSLYIYVHVVSIYI